MKFWGGLSSLVLLFVQGCATPAVDTIPPQLPDPVIEQKLRSILPAGWSLRTQGNNTFTISRDEKVWLYVQVAWDIGERSFEENVRKYGRETTYVITLRFEPPLTDSELQQLKLLREPYEKIVNEGARSKSEWANGVREFYKHKVPVYVTDKYSVFAERSDAYPVRIYPETAIPECKQVLASLDSLFQRYQQRTGKNSDF